MPVRRLLSGGLWFKAHPGKELKKHHLKKKTNKQTPSHKKAGEVDQGVGLDFKLQYHQKNRWNA
jgi:hypothetical protein